MMSAAGKVSVLIPVFNEKYSIEQIVAEVEKAELPAGMTRELIIVDDGSTDGTSVLVDRLAKQWDNLKVVHHEHNQGKGAALRTAIALACGDLCLVQDADLEYSPKDYTRLLAPIVDGHADVVYGSRFAAAESRRVLYFWHSAGNRFLTVLSNMLTNLNLTDMGTCYKVVRTRILKTIPIRCARFGVEPELTAKLAKRGCRIYEVPISYRGRTYAEGKKVSWWDGAKAVMVMLYFRCVDDLYSEEGGKEILQSLASAHRFNNWMAAVLRPHLGEAVVEIGAGLGNLTRQLVPRMRYVATDIDPIYLDYLENVYGHNERVEVAKLDVQDTAGFRRYGQAFDTAICLNVLEHVEDDVQGMRNMCSVLKPGGKACILVPQGPNLFGTLDRALNHVRRYTRVELEQKLAAAGFGVWQILDFNRTCWPAWWFNGRVLQRRHFGRVQLKIFDALIGLWRLLDRFLPWPGVSLIAIAGKAEDTVSQQQTNADNGGDA